MSDSGGAAAGLRRGGGAGCFRKRWCERAGGEMKMKKPPSSGGF